MDIPTKEDLTALSEQGEGYAVSIYMPTHKAGKDTRENPIRFKNRLQEAEEQLRRHGLKGDDIDALLAPARKLDDYRFWQNQREGLAVFVQGGSERHFLLPYAPDELTVVARRTHLKPLLPLLTGDGRFFILAMSLGGARLLEATRYSVTEVPVEGVPTSLEEALQYDDPEPFHEHYTVTAANRGGEALVQGQGAGEDERKTNILRFFRAFDNGLRALLAPQGDRIPVVFAGDKGLFPIYQEANHYNGLLDRAVEGNPEGLREEELHARAWEVVEPHFRAQRERDAAAFGEALGTGRAGTALEEVLWAALDARIATLFVPLGERAWGTFDAEARRLERTDEGPESYDLYDAAATYTLLYGGTVYAVAPDEVPGDGPLAAVYRF
ncbi:hypothetical protein [Truepera radiovictrix]|uniref:Uncharacterized protein n=1 Tax=Truepera radiovictrix (strain DSM 17093 / CIP 108686 / LMG 22925 / RQ-24) TaxID=649638 RepID=D7CRM1_TRURR|nr:hypothetical protein [Truepera radiovictrix]ADI13511.1 conserved hypothetical protein [Truepera radiovictrix DSM 17093]WMT57927.1 hypothetical protein RCV51_03010 [Truepera radiovictrix]